MLLFRLSNRYSIEYGENNLNCLKIVINFSMPFLSEGQAQNK